ncbi:unnamed protein product [Ostreobium quekettii]|uniref:Uncharacterized protein n=1 Tax=Ostreobium quekettii TaxID=121088 RepID=A0A8S1J2L3_9CHLO|nr:unnamed protein product [Ostreobium quekettii]
MVVNTLVAKKGSGAVSPLGGLLFAAVLDPDSQGSSAGCCWRCDWGENDSPTAYKHATAKRKGNNWIHALLLWGKLCEFMSGASAIAGVSASLNDVDLSLCCL